MEAFLRDLVRQKVPAATVADLYIPALARRLGDDWLDDRVSFMEVTLASSRMQGMLRAIGAAWTADLADPAQQGALLLIVVRNEQHTLGAMVLLGQLRRMGVSVRLSVGPEPSELRGVLTGVAWALDAKLEAYLVTWFVTALCGDAYLWVMAWRELRRCGLAGGIRPALRPDPEILPGAWRFAVNVNLTMSMNAAAGPVANLLVGGILGPAAAGMYRIARSLAKSIGSPAEMLENSFYPEVMRQDFNTKKPWKLMVRSAAVAGLIGAAICAVILIGGHHLISAIFGAEYIGAYPVVAIMTVATLLSAISFPVTPALYAMHRTNIPVASKSWATATFLLALYPLCRWAGINGAGFAYVIGDVLGIVLMLIALRREYVARIEQRAGAAAAVRSTDPRPKF